MNKNHTHPIGARLQEAARDKYGPVKTQSLLVNDTGISQSVIGKIWRGEAKDSVYTPQLAEKLGVRALWLADGSGEKSTRNISTDVTQDKTGAELSTGSVELPSNLDGGETDYIHVQSLELWSGSVADEVRGMTVPIEVLKSHDLDGPDVVSIRVNDNSQAPRILKGDCAAISIKSKGKPKNNKLYAVRLGGEYTLRLISYQHDGAIKLLCANPDFSSAEEVVPAPKVESLDILGEYIYGGMMPP